MSGKKRVHASVNPLPEEKISRNAPHGKTADDLPKPDDLPIKVLAKEIPSTDLHDM